jgi:ribosome-associated protein
MSKPERSRRPAPELAALPEPIRQAARAAQDKKASNVLVMDLRNAAAFTDYFVICSGQNPRQVHAIVEAIDDALSRADVEPAHVEGGGRSEWVLLDYFDFVVHVFTPETRAFYGLERLWGSADRIEIPDDEAWSAVEREH